MKKQHYQTENGSLPINGHTMSWSIMRSRTPSAFGIRGSRIFYLELKKDGKTCAVFNRGWDIHSKPDKDDEEAALCISYLVDKFGQAAIKVKKERGFQE